MAPPEKGKAPSLPSDSASQKNLSSFAGQLNQTNNDSQAALQARFALCFWLAVAIALLIWGLR
jgi:hypothetical protein